MVGSKLTAFAPAKINLTLRVLGKRPDGFHELESLVVFADIGDRVRAVRSSEWELSIDGPFASDLNAENLNDNLVLRAAKLTQKWASTKGVDIPPLRFELEKNLPIASGIGGGSSDAAAAIKLCLQAADLGIDDELLRAVVQLGADIPVCLKGEPTWMSGIGEDLTSAQVPNDLHLVLVNPGIAVSTAAVFGRLNAGPLVLEQESHPGFSSADQLIEFLKASSNDLQLPAMEIEPVIGNVLKEIAATGALIARMSGSGATCFGIYESAGVANDAAAQLSADHADWWVSL